MISTNDATIAYDNWINWKNVFEHNGEKSNNPLLANPELFKRFVNEYSVARTIRANCHDELRKVLSSQELNIDDILNDKTGQGIDILDNKLRKNFGTANGTRGLRSVISKISAFLAPDSFSAWDKFARIGVRRFGNLGSFNYTTYVQYLKSINTLLNTKEIKWQLEAAIRGSYPSEYAKSDHRFDRRVLDAYLMRLGGRVFSIA